LKEKDDGQREDIILSKASEYISFLVVTKTPILETVQDNNYQTRVQLISF
jgi:hypothetical protein